jgi:hypothetical protein
VKSLTCISDPVLTSKILTTLQAYGSVEACSPPEVLSRLGDVHVLIADEPALSRITSAPSFAQVIGITKGPPPEQVASLRRHPWLSQIVTPEVFDGEWEGRLLYGLSRQRAGEVPDSLAFLGMRHIHARRVLFYRSSHLGRRLERLEQFAGDAGARPRAIEQLHDITNELLANAFYDAPYEAGFLPRPPERQQSIELPPDLPCELVYGAIDDELFVRVRDCFGALTKARLMEVLARCAGAPGAVALDESRGGAGLGMWRIFRQASRVVICVVPQISTEMLISVPMSGLTRNPVRSWHLLFAPPPPDADTHVGPL